jgi:hypothetical protein
VKDQIGGDLAVSIHAAVRNPVALGNLMFLSESEISKMGDMLNNKGSMANV